MINWIPYDSENPPERDKKFLVLDGDKDIFTAELYDDKNIGLTWWASDGSGFIDPVTHYAEINLPGEGET